MGVSIFYQARRDRPLSDEERAAVDDIDRQHAFTDAVGENGELVEAPQWESFGIYPHDEGTEPGVIFEGSTKLPLTTEDEFWEAIQHWCRAITLVRRVLNDAEWRVHVDDHDITWNSALNAYDPSEEGS